MAQQLEMQTKVCSTCKIEKPFTQFSKHKGKPNNLRYSCKKCNNKESENFRQANPDYAKNHYEKNKTTILARQKLWHLQNKEKVKPVKQKYYKNNRDKIKEYQKQWLQNNHDKNRAKRARRRVAELGAKTFVITQKEIKKLYNTKCVYCSSVQNIELDHIIPLSRGGNHSAGNLVSACRTCNRSKGFKTITEWRLAKDRNTHGTK